MVFLKTQRALQCNTMLKMWLCCTGKHLRPVWGDECGNGESTPSTWSMAICRPVTCAMVQFNAATWISWKLYNQKSCCLVTFISWEFKLKASTLRDQFLFLGSWAVSINCRHYFLNHTLKAFLVIKSTFLPSLVSDLCWCLCLFSFFKFHVFSLHLSLLVKSKKLFTFIRRRKKKTGIRLCLFSLTDQTTTTGRDLFWGTMALRSAIQLFFICFSLVFFVHSYWFTEYSNNMFYS